MKNWNYPCPVVLAPSTYYNVEPQVFQDLGISLVIWSNHMLRSSITNMQRIARTIYEKKSVVQVEKQIASTEEVFRLQNMGELLEAERKYLPRKGSF